jgi:hypothetical protein
MRISMKRRTLPRRPEAARVQRSPAEMDYRIREARAEDADAAVRAHEEAWDAALAALAGIDGAAAASLWVVEANARARRFYEREGWVANGRSRETPLGPREVRYRRPAV